MEADCFRYGDECGGSVVVRLMPELREFHFYFVIDIMCLYYCGVWDV